MIRSGVLLFAALGVATSFQGSTVAVTVDTAPSGLRVTVDGVSWAAPHTFRWTVASRHRISAPPLQQSASAPLVWSNWSDNGALDHVITSPTAATTYVATFVAAPGPQLPTADARYAVEITFKSMTGVARCDEFASFLDGWDRFVGEVAGNEKAGGEKVDYVGDLKRDTKITHCIPVDTNRGASWCTPVLTATQEHVKVVISVWARRENVDTAWVELTPVPARADVATVAGACGIPMEQQVKDTLTETETIEIRPPSWHPLLDVLYRGIWQDMPVRPESQPDGWTLTVLRKIS